MLTNIICMQLFLRAYRQSMSISTGLLGLLEVNHSSKDKQPFKNILAVSPYIHLDLFWKKGYFRNVKWKTLGANV